MSGIFRWRRVCAHVALAATLVTHLAHAGTPHLVLDINSTPATDGSSPGWFMDWNGKAVFEAYDGIHGLELWISDGTAAGTRLLADIAAGALSSNPRLVSVWNGALYFFAYDGTSSHLMRMSAPDAAPEVLATALPPLRVMDGDDPEPVSCPAPNAVTLGNKLLFTARTLEAGTELWSTDGTAAGTTMVANLNTTLNFNLRERGSQPCYLTVFRNRVYFSASTIGDGRSEPVTPWSTDGTAAGTTPFGDFFDSTTFVVYNNELYFRANANGTVGNQTWKTDGTPAGTRPLVPATGSTDRFDAIPLGTTNGKLILSLPIFSDPLVPSGYKLWSSDGTTSPPVLLANTTLAGIAVTPDHVYFSNSPEGDEEPWISDGTLAGTHRLADLDSAGSSHPYRYFDFRGVVLITTNDSTGPHVWRTDGTESGTIQIGTLPKQGSAYPRFSIGTFGMAGQNFFFAAADDLHGDELYVVRNDAPVAVADTANAANGAAVTVNVLSNDADADGALNASTTVIVQAPAHGSASVGGNGAITYTPVAGYAGTDSFTYTVADNQGNASNAATVTLTVTAAPTSGGGGNDGGGGNGGGGPLRWLDVLLLAALAAWKLVRIAARDRAAGKNLSPLVNNL
jgi:ELWxxDGT repeat protein